LDKHNNSDINSDGNDEIVRLELVKDWSADQITSEDSVLVVLVEDRLIRNEQANGVNTLSNSIDTYCECLERDGWKPLVIRTTVYDGTLHQDGRTVLAIRRLFHDVKKSYPNFGGAVLIGSFPECMLVRRWVWKHKSRRATFNGIAYNKGKGPKATFIAMDPELISHRSDVVLCDLDGNWEDIYVQEKTDIDSIKFIPDQATTESSSWPQLDQTITTDKFSFKAKPFEDFFFIDDADFKILHRTEDKLSIQCGYKMLRPEVGERERGTRNPLAEPDIMVSRINPRHVGVIQPKNSLDQEGKPKALPLSAGSPNRKFKRDAAFERKLVIEYLERNIAHRNGETISDQNQVASLWTDLQTPSKKYFARVSRELNGTKSFGKANAVDFVRFMKTPAIVKGVSAHSNPGCSVLIGGYKKEDLANESGGNYWFWMKSKDQYVPSYNHGSVKNRVHFALLRTLWENKVLDVAGSSFYVHGGCEAVSPYGASKYPFNSTKYGGHNQIAECLLFYGNGLGLIGRSKVYFDIPRGFDSAFGVDRGNFGDILIEYFRVEANDAKLARSVASRNRTYFWNILGDWTLKLNYPNLANVK